MDKIGVNFIVLGTLDHWKLCGFGFVKSSVWIPQNYKALFHLSTHLELPNDGSGLAKDLVTGLAAAAAGVFSAAVGVHAAPSDAMYCD